MSRDDQHVEFFSKLYEDLTDRPADLDAMREALEERGVDVTATITQGLALIAEHKKRMRLVEAREQLGRIRGMVAEWAARGSGSLSAAKDDLARALSGETGGPAYQAYHRKLGKVSAEDLESLTEDAALLEFLDEIDADQVDG